VAAALALLTPAVMTQGAHGSESFRQVRCLAQNIYFEARGESALGQLGVAHVVMNRVLDREFPATICDVVTEGGTARRGACQFSWWCDGQSDRPTDLAAWKRSFKVALQTYFGKTTDPTQGALWYHADYVQPAWRRNHVLGPRIGRHLFYWRSGPLPRARYMDLISSQTRYLRSGGSTAGPLRPR
jgi:spore germination cell wall hydrolase CwlJ-like protein